MYDMFPLYVYTYLGGYGAPPPSGGYYPPGPAYGYGPPPGTYPPHGGAGFYDRPPRGARGGSRGRTRERGPPRYEEFKEPDPGMYCALTKPCVQG